MKCSEVRTFLSQINDREEPITQIPSADLNYLATNGYISTATKDAYDAGTSDIARLTQLTVQLNTVRPKEELAAGALEDDQRESKSFMFHFKSQEEKDEMHQRVQGEMSTAS